MTLGMVAVPILVGLLAGWLAGFVMKGGGYGLIVDILLGFGGSIVGGWLFSALGIAPDVERLAMIVVASVGAVILIFAQRALWQPHA